MKKVNLLDKNYLNHYYSQKPFYFVNKVGRICVVYLVQIDYTQNICDALKVRWKLVPAKNIFNTEIIIYASDNPNTGFGGDGNLYETETEDIETELKSFQMMLELTS